MHHIWFLSVGIRFSVYADIPRHQPRHYPRYIRWLIWLMGFFAGGWVNPNRDYDDLLLPSDTVDFGVQRRRFRQYRRYWDPRKHFDWVLDAYPTTESTPELESESEYDDIPF